MPIRTLSLLLCLFSTLGMQADPGIRSLVVFGDSLCDAGNSALWAAHYEQFIEAELVESPELIPRFPWPYFGNRASNGPTWIEQIGQAYHYEVVPSLSGGSDFAFSGAESGPGLSDQFTPNFHLQVRLYQEALKDHRLPPPTPWQLFVVWFGVNDVQRALASLDGPVDPEVFARRLAQSSIGNITQGIEDLSNLRARIFLVPNLPPMQLTPFGASQPASVRRLLVQVTTTFNTMLEEALQALQDRHPKLTILRFNVAEEYTKMVAMPAAFGFLNALEPAFFIDENGFAWNWNPDDMANFDPDQFLSWDGFHPTAAAHTLLARKAMDSIPIGAWWMHSRRPWVP